MNIIDYNSINEHIFYEHRQVMHPKFDFHLHKGCEMYFLISGDVDYFVENKIYPIEYGDLMITNNLEIHKPSFQSDKLYERIILQFSPSFIRQFSSPDFDLLYCFEHRQKGDQNRIRFSRNQSLDILQLFNKIGHQCDNMTGGCEILKLNYVIELLVYTNRVFMNLAPDRTRLNIPGKLVSVIDYIENHLDSDLSLETLSRTFYIDKYYLCKLFKKNIGSNVHNFIIYKRISRAKILLSQGLSVTEACSKCGFNDYSNFIKIFKRTVGISPGKYKLNQ